MAEHGYTILFAGPTSGSDLHRIRNFAEDLDRALREGAIGGVPSLDHIKAEVVVNVSARRFLGPALRTIRIQLARSNFDDNVSIARLP